jgi:predicted transcriptional regulator
MILQTKEAEVLERLRVGMRQMDIAVELNIKMGSVYNIITRLSDIGAVQSNGRGKYRVLIDKYRKSEATPDSRMEKLIVIVPKSVEKYIRQNYKAMTRSELAKKLNLDKFTLNMMILQLGMGGL